MSPREVTPLGRTGRPGRTRLTSRGPALALLAVGGALALASSVQAWARLEAADALGEISVTVSGAALVPLVPAAAVVGLAAVLAVPSVRGWVRRAVGAVVLGLGMVAVFATATTLMDVSARAQRWWRVDVGAVAETASVDVSWWWPSLTLVGLGTMVVGAGVVLVRGGRWSGLSARYERPSRPSGSETPASDTEAWQALDRGEDPTAP